MYVHTGCSLNIVFFPRIFESLPPLPRQHSAAIGCTKNYQPIGVTVHSHYVESFEGLLQRCRRGRGSSELLKNTIPEHPICCRHLWICLFRKEILTFSRKVFIAIKTNYKKPQFPGRFLKKWHYKISQNNMVIINLYCFA